MTLKKGQNLVNKVKIQMKKRKVKKKTAKTINAAPGHDLVWLYFALAISALVLLMLVPQMLGSSVLHTFTVN